MSNRSAQRWFAAATLVVGATVAGAGAAHAGTVVDRPAYIAPPGTHGGDHHYRDHDHPNCNNDPDSEFAQDPEICPPSHNGPGY